MVTKQMLAKAVAALKQATLATDLKMNIIYMNDLAEKMLGCKPGTSHTAPLNLTIKDSPYPDTFDGELNTPDGKHLKVRLSVTPMSMGSKITGYIFRMVPQDTMSFHPAVLN